MGVVIFHHILKHLHSKYVINLRRNDRLIGCEGNKWNCNLVMNKSVAVYFIIVIFAQGKVLK